MDALTGLAGKVSGLPIPSLTGAAGAPAAAPKIDPSQTKEICDQFKSLFKENETLYADAIKDAVTKYFASEEMIKELNASFSKAILQYMNNQSFKQVAQVEVSKVLGEILREPIEKALKNHERYTNICKSILAKKRTVTGGRRAKSRKMTIKRRK
jgi:hypothetical protein